jgi:hypothetical protein
MPLIESVVQSVVKSAVQRIDGVLKTPSLLLDAFGAWSTYDLYGTSSNVVRLRNPNSSPTERDFTATELTDGTYTSWYSSGDTFVSRMYDQKSSYDLFNVSAFTQPKYNSTDNAVQHYAVNPYATSVLSTDVSSGSTAVSDINNTFEGNTLNNVFEPAQPTSLVMSMAKTSGSVGYTNRPAFGVYENAPVGPLSRGHRNIITGGGDFSTDTGISMRTNYPTSGFVEEFTSGFSSSQKTHIATFARESAPGIGPYTRLKMYEDGVSQINRLTTNLGTDISQDMFIFGFNGGIQASTLVVFASVLTDEQQAAIHTELSANY